MGVRYATPDQIHGLYQPTGLTGRLAFTRFCASKAADVVDHVLRMSPFLHPDKIRDAIQSVVHDRPHRQWYAWNRAWHVYVTWYQRKYARRNEFRCLVGGTQHRDVFSHYARMELYEGTADSDGVFVGYQPNETILVTHTGRPMHEFSGSSWMFRAMRSREFGQDPIDLVGTLGGLVFEGLLDMYAFEQVIRILANLGWKKTYDEMESILRITDRNDIFDLVDSLNPMAKTHDACETRDYIVLDRVREALDAWVQKDLNTVKTWSIPAWPM